MRFSRVGLTLITAIAVTACSSSQHSVGHRNSVSIHLSGTEISLSAPPGHLMDVSVPNIDLAENRNVLTSLFERAWVEGGLTGDKGAIEVKLLLAKHRTSKSKNFIESVQEDYKVNLSRVFTSPRLGSAYPSQIGNAQWICFRVEDLGVTDCTRELPYDHYLIWRRKWIANHSPLPTSKLEELADQIEKSIHITSATS